MAQLAEKGSTTLERAWAVLTRPAVVRALLIVLGLLPPLLLLADIRRLSVNVPFMDDWQFIPLLEKTKAGTLTWTDLWAPHDEHRLLLPRTIIIAAMFATHGDYRVQCLITFATVAIVSICLLWLALRLNGNRVSVFWTWALVNVALFSPIQFHNWLWPMQFAYFLPYTFFALCVCVLYARIPTAPKFAVAALLALAGNFSFVQGNLIWLGTLPIILFVPGILEARERRTFAIGWAVVGLAAVTFYFVGLEKNAAAADYAYGHVGIPPTMTTLNQLQRFPLLTLSRMGRFILGMFGNSISRGFPVADNLDFTLLCGTVVLVLAVLGLGVAWRRGLFRNRALPWACLLLFTFLTAAFVCVGRVWRGDAQPLTPRYATFGAFCIVALIELLAAAFSGLGEQLETTGLRITLTWIQGLSVGIFLMVQGVNWTYGRQLMEEWNSTRWHSLARLHFLGKIQTQARADLLGGKDELIIEGAEGLERLGMMKPRASDLRISTLGTEGHSISLKRGRFDDLIMRGLNGWRARGSALASESHPADAVILGIQNDAGEWVAIAAATPLGAPAYLAKSTRMDLEFLATSGSKSGEWEIDLPLGIFGSRRTGTVRAWAMNFQKQRLYRLDGDQTFLSVYPLEGQTALPAPTPQPLHPPPNG